MYFALLLSIVFPIFVPVNGMTMDEKYHQVPALKDETAFDLLQRYNLEKYPCNIDQFSKLNNVQIADKLIENKVYQLPVLLFEYNGKSIQSTLQFSDWEKAHRIKSYNELMLQKKLRRQTIIDSRILWVPYHEFHCSDDESEPEVFIGKPAKNLVETNIKGTRKFPIFGSSYENVPEESSKLQGKIFYIVSGHGGPDPGAIGKRGAIELCEDEYAYDVCLRLSRKLIANGATAYMIIRDPNDGIRDEQFLQSDQDEYCWGGLTLPHSQKNRLQQRSDAINTLYQKNKKIGINDQYVITIHLDSRHKGQRTDVFFYYKPECQNGKGCAEKIQLALAKKYAKYRSTGQYKGTVNPRNLHMLREVEPTSVFIELGNILNKKDQERFIFAYNRQYLAEWIFEGILSF